MWFRRKFFENHVVWITGAGSGIGRGLALEFTRRGAKVALSGRRRHKLEEVAEECKGLGGEVLVVPCDVCDDSSVSEALQQILAHFQQLDVAVANAGFSVKGAFEELSIDDWKRQFETNVFGLIRTAKVALPPLKERRGRLALIGSVMGSICLPTYGPYQASKFAVRAIGQTLSIELHGTGVSCTHIQPGLVESELMQVDNQGRFHPEWKDRRPRFFIWSSERAARVMVKAIWRRKREFVFTGHGKLGAFLGNHFPGLSCWFMARWGKKVIPR